MLLLQLGYDMSANEARRRVIGFLNRANEAIYVAADGEVVGGPHLGRPERSARTRAEIRALIVDERRRSSGIGYQRLSWGRICNSTYTPMA